MVKAARIKVIISTISNTFILNKANKGPAIIGEIRNLDELAICISELAFTYSSFVNRSVIVALYDGSRSDENIEHKVIPVHI